MTFIGALVGSMCYMWYVGIVLLCVCIVHGCAW